MGNIKYLVSDTVGWTVGTKEGNSAFLDPGQKVEAKKVVDSIIEDLEEGGGLYDAFGHLEEIDPIVSREQEAEKAAMLARVQGSGVVEEDDIDDEDVEGGDPDDPAKDDPSKMTTAEGGVKYDPSDHTVAEVMDHLKTVTDSEEVDRIKTLEAASSRGSTQVAAFEFVAPDPAEKD